MTVYNSSLSQISMNVTRAEQMIVMHTPAVKILLALIHVAATEVIMGAVNVVRVSFNVVRFIQPYVCIYVVFDNKLLLSEW